MSSKDENQAQAMAKNTVEVGHIAASHQTAAAAASSPKAGEELNPAAKQPSSNDQASLIVRVERFCNEVCMPVFLSLLPPSCLCSKTAVLYIYNILFQITSLLVLGGGRCV